MDDYIPVSQTLTFNNERQKCVNITIIDDPFLERSVEIIKLTLTRTEGLNERIQFTTDEGVIRITENDGTNLNFYSKLVLISLFSSHSYSRSGEDNVQCIRR